MSAIPGKRLQVFASPSRFANVFVPATTPAAPKRNEAVVGRDGQEGVKRNRSLQADASSDIKRDIAGLWIVRKAACKPSKAGVAKTVRLVQPLVA